MNYPIEKEYKVPGRSGVVIKCVKHDANSPIKVSCPDATPTQKQKAYLRFVEHLKKMGNE
jgi:hypothetical protein